MEFDLTRWAVYLTAGPIALAAYLLFVSRYGKLLLLIGTLIFLENVLLSWRLFYFVGFSISSALAYVFLVSLAPSSEARHRMPALSFAWAAFLFFAFMGALVGAFVPKIGIGENLALFQMFYLEGLIYFWIGRAALQSSQEAHKLLVWLVIFGGFVAILHLFSVTTGYRFYAAAGRDMGEFSTVAFRYGAVFVNPNTLADFYAMVIPAGIVVSMGWVGLARSAMFGVLASVSIMGVSLLVTASRGGLAAAMLLSGVAVLLLPFNARRLAGLTVLSFLSFGVAAALLVLLFPEFLELALARFTDEGLESLRYRTWALTLQILAENPFGVGLHFSGYMNALSQYGIRLGNPHNIYLGIAVNAGIPGLIAFLFIVAGCLRRVLRARRFGDATLRTVATAVLVLLLGFLVSGFFEPIYRNGFKLQHLFWLFAGLGSFLPSWIAMESGSAPDRVQATESDWATADAGVPSLRRQRVALS